MKAIISIVTGISLVALMGCNNVDRDREGTDAETTISRVDTTETERQAIADSEMNATSSTASEQASQEEDANFTETEEVVQIDTVGMKVEYDVRRRIIEQVDTVGATTTYEVERKIVKRRIRTDTVTETASKEEQVSYEEGDFQVLNEEVERDTVTETIDNPTPEQLKQLRILEESRKSEAADRENPESETQRVTNPQTNPTNQPAEEPQPQQETRTNNPASEEDTDAVTPAGTETRDAGNQTPEVEPEVEEEETQSTNQTVEEAEENTENTVQETDSLERNAPSYQPRQQEAAQDTTSEGSN